MRRNKYYLISGLVFLAVSVLHLIRALLSIPMVIGEWIVPMWMSWAAFLGAGFLCLIAFTLLNKYNAR